MIEHLVLGVASIGLITLYANVYKPLLLGCLLSWLARNPAASRRCTTPTLSWFLPFLAVVIAVEVCRPSQSYTNDPSIPALCLESADEASSPGMVTAIVRSFLCMDCSWLTLRALLKSTSGGLGLSLPDASDALSAAKIIATENIEAATGLLAAAWYTMLTSVHPFDAAIDYLRRNEKIDGMLRRLAETYAVWWEVMVERAAIQTTSSWVLAILCVPNSAYECAMGVLLLCFFPIVTPEIMLLAAVNGDIRRYERSMTLLDVLPLVLACYNWFFWSLPPFAAVPHQHSYWVTIGMTVGWASYGLVGSILSVGLGAIPFIVFFEESEVTLDEKKLLQKQMPCCSDTPTTSTTPPSPLTTTEKERGRRNVKS